jgi:D-alanine-D-alanine ligase
VNISIGRNVNGPVRVGIVSEMKHDYLFRSDEPAEANSELLSDDEEDAILSGLRDAGHEVMRIGDGSQLVRRVGFWRNRCDLVFNLSVGYRGLDRKSFVPGVLELADIPYVGSGPYSLSLTRHKYHAKLVAAAAGICTAPAALWTDPSCTERLRSLPYPVIVKPVAESSSIGIARGLSVLASPEEAADRARWLVDRFHQPALVETFVRGTEVEVPVLGWPKLRPLGVVAITLAGAFVCDDLFLTADTVYDDQYGFAAPPAGIDQDLVMETAAKAANALGIRDYGRIDFRVADDGRPYFLEASTHPHIQPHSSFYVLGRSRVRSYPQMLDEIVGVARSRLAL